MEEIVVKTEVQPNEEILLFYVDEDGGNEQGVLTTVENIEQVHGQQLQQENYVLDDITEEVENVDLVFDERETSGRDRWLDEEIRRLLVFYIDNKDTFINGTTKKKHLWTVACKTMLTGKNPTTCELKMRNLKKKYSQVLLEQKNGYSVTWPYFQICHEAFHDDTFVNMLLKESEQGQATTTISSPFKPNTDNGGIVVIKKISNTRSAPDEKVVQMLKLYIKHKSANKDPFLWDTIALELGEENGEYWYKRFFNYKQHYIRMLEKRQENGPNSINWPYMELFDEMFEHDVEFQRKFAPNQKENRSERTKNQNVNEWSDTETTVLVKYYFDCYHEFQDTTIPNNFLWNEVGRLLDKNHEICRSKYEELRNVHLDTYIQRGYDVRTRIPRAIILDNIIAKDVQTEMGDKGKKKIEKFETWETQEIDELVQFIYDNVEMFKDPICHFVCWAAIAKELKRSIAVCKKQWEDLILLYKSILNEKKEDSDMQIDWRYIEFLDRIFDYGMDANLLDGYEKLHEDVQKNESGKVAVKKLNINMDNDKSVLDNDSDEEEYDERGFLKRKRRTGESKAFQILEYYQKHKEKFSTTQRKKQALWEILAKQIGISAEQCAHRFRNLKQVYTGYVQREISKPEMPILWPYYALCKKVFGYRALKNKLKNGKLDSDDVEEWSAKEIKQLINYFSQHFNDINNDTDDTSKWSQLACDIGKTENSCRDKFLELRRSYRKLKTMRIRNPDVKLSWKYYKMFEEIYNSNGGENLEGIDEAMDVDEDENMQTDEKQSEQGDDDYQCIIVIPEGQDLSDIENAQIIIKEDTGTSAEIVPPAVVVESTEPVDFMTSVEVSSTMPSSENLTNGTTSPLKWTKRTKKRLLMLYLKYIRCHKGKAIDSTEMWKEIASKLPDKTPLSCRRIFAKLKNRHSQPATDDDVNKKKNPYYTLIQKILAFKPKFVKSGQCKTLKEGRTYKDVPLPTDKVQQALEYYFQHIEEFVNPKFEKKYLWTELANHVTEPVNKIFNKLNYLKQNYNIETNQVAGESTIFGEVLNNILTKENDLKELLNGDPKPVITEENESIDQDWSDDEIEQLLIWYLANLEKFKNPKFVRRYLWMEVSNILQKSPLACSKKMSEVRTEYRNMVRESSDALCGWRFYDLCQKIYGTGKKVNPENSS